MSEEMKCPKCGGDKDGNIGFCSGCYDNLKKLIQFSCVPLGFYKEWVEPHITALAEAREEINVFKSVYEHQVEKTTEQSEMADEAHARITRLSREAAQRKRTLREVEQERDEALAKSERLERAVRGQAEELAKLQEKLHVAGKERDAEPQHFGRFSASDLAAWSGEINRRKNPWTTVKAEECKPTQGHCVIVRYKNGHTTRGIVINGLWRDNENGPTIDTPNEFAIYPQAPEVTLDFHAVQPPDNLPEPDEKQKYAINGNDKLCRFFTPSQGTFEGRLGWYSYSSSGPVRVNNVVAYTPIPPRTEEK